MNTQFQPNSNQRFAILGLFAVLTLDISTPLGFAIGVLYVPCVFLISRESVTTIYTITLIAVAFIVIKVVVRTYYPINTDWMVTDKMVFFNRSISIIAVIITGLLAIRNKMSEKKEDEKK